MDLNLILSTLDATAFHIERLADSKIAARVKYCSPKHRMSFYEEREFAGRRLALRATPAWHLPPHDNRAKQAGPSAIGSSPRGKALGRGASES